MKCCSKLRIYFIGNLAQGCKTIVNNMTLYKPFFAFRQSFWSSRAWFRMWGICFFIAIYSVINGLGGYIKLGSDNDTFNARKMSADYLITLLGAELFTPHFFIIINTRAQASCTTKFFTNN